MTKWIKTSKRNKQIKDFKKKSEYYTKITVKCKCGHSIQFRSRSDRIVCSYCGNVNFRNKKCEYDYKIKRLYCSR